ncbi:MAG: tetratricopeptide repeat protein [Blastocatellia bacterium]
MTMNYCGRCGAANGTAARYCRQCGAELHNQAVMSAASAPLNVEFSARSVTKDFPPMTKPESQAYDKADTGKLTQPKAPTGKFSAQPTVTTSPENGDEPKDAKAISESLKRIRASGPLLVEAVKKKQERVNQIIADALDNKDSKGRKGESKSGQLNGKTSDSKTALTTVEAETSPPKSQYGSSSSTTISRRVTGSFSTSNSTRSTGSLGNHNGAHAQTPPQGPSSVLAQASGLGKNSNLGSKLRISLIAALVVVAASGYFLLRDRLSGASPLATAGRNLKSVEEQSSDLVKLGQRDREQGQYDSAIGYFQNALALTPNNLETRFLLAQTFLSARQTDEALRNYNVILRANPDHREARLQIAEIHRAAGNWPAALAEYKRVIALAQDSPEAAFALETIEAYEAGKPLPNPAAPRKNEVAKAKGAVLPNGNPQVEIPLQPLRMTTITGIKPPMTNRPEERPDPRVIADGHKKLGLRYYNIREYPVAIKEFLAAYRLNPDDKDMLYFIGSCYYGLEQFGLAHSYFIRVDSGAYVGIAQANAARTEKAAKREESLRNKSLKGDQLNQVNIDPKQKNKGSLNGTE